MWEDLALVARKDANGIINIDEPWPTKDIIYVSIVGSVMLAALLEWFLWVAAFLYCLVKVFQKAETISVRILAVIVGILFFCLRAIFLPIMVVTLPLPPQVTKYFPEVMVSFLQWFAFWSFAGLLTVPWLFCVYQLVTHSVGRQKRIKTVLDESSAPKVVIVMPCYKEVPDVLMRTIDSLVDCDYPPSCLHIFLSFDGDQEDELYLNTIEKLGVPLTLDSYPKSIDVTYRSCRITVSRFPHGGKRHCQKRTFKLIDKIYTEYLKRNDNLFMLFIDSDCILDKVCIQNFMYEMELKPGSKKNMLAMTGVITSTTEKNSLITVLQDMEYIHGQLFERSVESGCGAVTCLPGALTILRFSAFRRMSKYYFADKAEQCDDLFDYGKCHLGEDRWLTHLFMIGAKERYQIQMNTGAFCKTEAVQTYRSLLKQRRRWFLGFITNEVCMLTDIRLWKRYTILCLVRFMQNTIRTTALLFFILVISIITTSQKIGNLPVGFIAISLGLNWVLMLYFGAKLGRYKIMLYPLMFIVNPFFNWCYMVYGIFTAGQRTWGGPRADAGTADSNTTPQQAIENAEATGDDLNVVPETFKPAAEAQKGRPAPVPLQPSDQMDGRFSAAQRLPGGWYQQANDSGLTLPNMMPRDANVPRVPLHPHDPRTSIDSLYSSNSNNNSIYLPRRVESFMDPEDARIYHKTQASQKPAGGAYFESGRNPDSSPYQYSAGMAKTPYQESVGSLSDDSTYQGQSGKLPQRPAHARSNSDKSASGQRTASPPTPIQGKDGLEVPKGVHTRDGQRDTSGAQSSQARQGRSPLARQSYTRSTQDLGIEMQPAQQQQRSQLRETSPSSATTPQEEQPQPSHERSDSRDSEKKKRRRLTKSPPGTGK
ncbi:glycosyltransferase family 2 protein [Aaosphaeria arxii CBS 175.79]|uniref:chitin synthase n=1 Tax=Aaosphaeria arxii CBS 175.79 TaxID=1450172 RepID=A0A6A5XB94_9PLEO|nr:glycosyltransferase family 2 protein [Aaosphaeria arxii CBS 175.79]KAF2010345.1 glycosyltransferase family 2 protein [Aaosphaeria arxii CBS 175.79]